MLDKDTLMASGKKEFDQKAKEFFVNMQGNVRTLHKTNNKSCPHSKCAYSFLTFSTIEEVVAYEKKHMDATPFKRCGNCFKKR